MYFFCRRKGNKNKDDTEVQSNIHCTDDDSDGLKYNTLYNASEQQEIMEGDYHTVEIQGKQSSGIQNVVADSSSVDGNYTSIDIVNMSAKDGFKTDRKIKSTFNTTPSKCISVKQQSEEEKSNNVKHVTPIAGNTVEYAVVEKRGITDKNIKHIAAPNDSNVEYAVIDKKKCMNIKTN